MEPPDSLYEDLAGIGVEISAVEPNRSADIERTLLLASSHVDGEDRRLLGYLASWISVHAGIVCVGKLKRIMSAENLGDSQVVSALAFLAIDFGFHEWKLLAKEFPERPLWNSASTSSSLKMKGADPNFERAGLLLPKSFLRIRASDILPIEALCKVHLQARLRLIFGANLRADGVYYLSKGALSASELMRKIGSSYEPAHRILEELKKAGSLVLPKVRGL
jgi:hypothetical protein